MNITIIGHGYVGLVTACVFAHFGNQVRVLGRTPEKLKKLNAGDPLIYEPGLEEMLQKNLEAKRISFGSDYEVIKDSQIVFIAVGTPPGENGAADLSQVFEVTEKIATHLGDQYTVVACKSTVPVGTNLEIKKILQKKAAQQKFDVASCPEFLREGTGINDTLFPDRVIIGSENKQAAQVLLDLHAPIGGERVVTDLASAELIKYASNSILATKISFANLISFYCEKSGADVEQVLDAVGADNRIGRKFLYPGIGYGGACFPKDVQSLAAIGHQLGVNSILLEQVQVINWQAKSNFVDKIIDNFHPPKVTHSGGQGKIAIWGLAFKPNTDDIREAPSRFIIQKLLDQGYELTVYDPEAQGHIKKLFGEQLKYATDPYNAAKEAEALVILTEWDEFKQIDLLKVKKLLKEPVIFDGRNIYELEKMKELGFTYFSVGRKTVK